MKHTFEQVPPEYQESPLFLTRDMIDEECENLRIRIFDCAYMERFADHSCKLIDRIESEIQDAHDANDETYGDEVTTDELLDALKVETGEEWEVSTICGSSQGEWRRVLHRAAIREYIRGAFSIEYWNEGSEWTDEDGCGYYVTAWNDDGIRRELAEYVGCDPEDVVLMEFDGWDRSPRYREV